MECIKLSLNPLSFSLFGIRFYFTPKFTLVALFAIVVSIVMGFWQTEIVRQKTGAINAVNTRIGLTPIRITNLETEGDWRFYPAIMEGNFDNDHQFLLNDRIYQGQLGYEVLTPFRLTNSNKAILINRGWIPALADPTVLPELTPVVEEVTLTGLLVQPPSFFLPIPNFDHSNVQWPLVVKHIDIKELTKTLGYPLYSYMVLLEDRSPYGFVRDWKELLIQLEPAKNVVLAIEWFAFAAAVLFAYFFLNTHRE